LTDGVETIEHRHRDVDDYHVGIEFVRGLDERLPIVTVPTARIRLQQTANP